MRGARPDQIGRLAQLGEHRWVDLDEVVSVHVDDGATAGYELVARIGLRNGQQHMIKIPDTHTQPWNDRLQEQSDAARDNWLADKLGAILEGVLR